jgi:hypothetical protein
VRRDTLSSFASAAADEPRLAAERGGERRQLGGERALLLGDKRAAGPATGSSVPAIWSAPDGRKHERHERHKHAAGVDRAHVELVERLSPRTRSSRK